MPPSARQVEHGLHRQLVKRALLRVGAQDTQIGGRLASLVNLFELSIYFESVTCL